jgi:hypothetical protein
MRVRHRPAPELEALADAEGDGEGVLFGAALADAEGDGEGVFFGAALGGDEGVDDADGEADGAEEGDDEAVRLGWARTAGDGRSGGGAGRLGPALWVGSGVSCTDMCGRSAAVV